MNNATNYEARIREKREQNPFISQTELVYDILLEDILLQIRKPGSRIRQEQLVEQFNVSRSPIRDAIAMLVSEGFLVRRSRNGYYVVIMTIKETLGLIEYRTAIEVQAGYLAMRRSTSEDLAFLKKNLQAIADCDNQNFEKILELDTIFHNYLIACSKNEYLIRAYELYARHFRMLRNASLKRDMQENIVVRHQRIVSALESKNEVLLEKAIREHLQNILDDSVSSQRHYTYGTDEI